MKPKILYIIDNLEFGGGERGFAQLAGSLKHRYEILFACQPGGLLGERLQQIGVPIRPLDFHRQVSTSRIVRLSAILREEGVHLVHSMGTRADFSARIAARLARVPLAVSTIAMFVEGYDVPLFKRAVYRAGVRLSERFCDGFIAVSDAIRKVLVEDHRIPQEKVVRIYNGVELDTFRPEGQDRLKLKQDLDLAPEAPVVGTIGRLVYQKAQDVFLEAASTVVQAVPDAQFLIVGEGPLRPSLERMKEDLGLHTCRFAGFRPDIPNMLSIMDIFALPSILEGVPRVLLEALAMARPVVASSIDGVAEVAQHDVTALLVPPGEPTALADAIISLLEDKDRASQFGEAGRKLAEERFDLRRTVEEVDRFYTTLLQKKGIQ